MIKEIVDKATWEDFLLKNPHKVFLQSWNWGAVHELSGKKILRLGIFTPREIVGVAQVIQEEARRGRHWLIPGGPVLGDWQNRKNLSELVEYLNVVGKNEKVVFVRLRPNIDDSPENNRVFKGLGLVKAPMHLHAETTLQLDLGRSEEELMAQMRKNTRYSIRRAEREGVTTEVSFDQKSAATLYRLQMEVVRRRHFVPFSQEFFEKHFEAFHQDDQIAYIKADYRGETLAIGMFVFYGGTASYHYSGSSLKYPNVFASYAMLWRAIQEARRRGCETFDFWGIAPGNDPQHRFAGVTLFKTGFGGKRIDYLKAYDLPISKKYWAIYAFETARRKSRRL